MTTAARVHEDRTPRWYDRVTCQQVSFVPKADGKGETKATLAHAKKSRGRMVPSVTSILKVIAAPELEAWKAEQVALAIATAPRLPGESVDALIHRVLHVEEQQREEARLAADKGTRLHEAVVNYLAGNTMHSDTIDWVRPVCEKLNTYGMLIKSEFPIIGQEGYGGRVDLLMGSAPTVVDIKTTRSMPKNSPWPAHSIQIGAYAKAIGAKTTVVAYVDTVNIGKFNIFESDSSMWSYDFVNGFMPTLRLWEFLNGYESNKEFSRVVPDSTDSMTLFAQ